LLGISLGPEQFREGRGVITAMGKGKRTRKGKSRADDTRGGKVGTKRKITRWDISERGPFVEAKRGGDRVCNRTLEKREGTKVVRKKKKHP